MQAPKGLLWQVGIKKTRKNSNGGSVVANMYRAKTYGEPCSHKQQSGCEKIDQIVI